MYGVDAEVMRRMERRIKEKIYREMIEEEEKQRRKQREDKVKSREFQFRNLTQPSDRSNRRARPNRYEDDQNNSLVEQQSSFLPVINSRQRPAVEQEAPNSSYKEYVQKREERTRPQRSKSRYNKRSSTSAALPTDYDEERQQSEEEKAEKYLTQCQQIISNLREITKKNNKKAIQRESKYQPPSPQFASKNKSFNGTLTPKQPIRESLTYSSKRNEPISLRIVRPSQPKNQDIGYQYEALNSRKSITLKKSRVQQEPNQFYQFQQSPSRYPPKVNTRKLSPLQTPQNQVENQASKSNSKNKNTQSKGESKPQKKEKARENFKRLSPIKTQAQEAEDDVEKGQEEDPEERPSQQEEEQEKPQPPPKKEKKDNSPKKEPKTLAKPKNNKEQKPTQEEEEPEDEEPSPKQGNDSKKEKQKLQKQKARQKAIVKYLKKARMRGNLLYQKMESQKPGQQQQGGGQAAQGGGQVAQGEGEVAPAQPLAADANTNPNDPK